MHFLRLFAAVAVLLCARAQELTAGCEIAVDAATRTFVDAQGRQRLFHGVNAVYKVAPWHPVLSGFDSNNTLSSEDAVLLHSYGFNVVRLGVMWPGVEPGKEGVYDESYLDAIEQIVDSLANQGIYTLLDLHQDLWHRKYCGEGVPDYVQQKCASTFTGKPFPAPVAGAYPNDADGNPELASCLSKSFFAYYLSSEVGSAFQCLYDNHENLWTSMGNFWQVVAKRFKSKPSVLGYEIINEPWMGDVYKHPELALPGKTEKQYLQPMYEHVTAMIRQVDDVKLIFFEGLTIDYWPSGFTKAPGSDPSKAVISYHIYCMPDPNKAEAVLCSGVNDEFFQMRAKDSERLGSATFMTEFGATSSASAGALHDLDSLTKQSDKHQQSWQYWQYKYYQDLTTCTPSGESLFNDDGTPAKEKLDILTRPYPAAIAGKLESYAFFDANNAFVLKYSLLTTLPPDSGMVAPTIVRLNAAAHYPHGLSVVVTGPGAGSLTFQCVDISTLLLMQVAAVTAAAAAVEVTLSGDCVGEKCSCLF